jgi:phosphoglucomutase
LLSGSLGFVGEESAGASFCGRMAAWTTDKDGYALALLSAEMTARLGKDPDEVKIARSPGNMASRRMNGMMHLPPQAQKDVPGKVIAENVQYPELGDPDHATS